MTTFNYDSDDHNRDSARGFLVRDLIRFFIVDITIKAAIELLWLIHFFSGPDQYVLVIMASKMILLGYLVWLVNTRRRDWSATGIATLGKGRGWLAAAALYGLYFYLLPQISMINFELLNGIYARLGRIYEPQIQDVQLLIFGGVLQRPVVIVLIAFTVLIGPFLEELAFRGVGIDGFRRRAGSAMAIVWTGLLFGIYHLSFEQLLPLSLLGIILGAARLASGSLWCPLLVHCAHNTLVLVIHASRLGYFALPWG